MNGKVLNEYEVRSGAMRGARLALYADRLVLQSDSTMEIMPLSHLASVRIAFERVPARFNWAIVLLLLALLLWAIAGPLQNWSVNALGRLAEPGRRESFDALIAALFGAIGGFARLLPWIAAALAAGGAASAIFFWLGRTTLLVSVGAGEREISVRGRDAELAHFADALAAQLVASGK